MQTSVTFGPSAKLESTTHGVATVSLKVACPPFALGRASGLQQRHAVLALVLTLTLGLPAAGLEQSNGAGAPTPSTSSNPPQTAGAKAKPVPLDRNGQIALIRGLSSEVAVAKLTLPRGKHGILLDSRGKLDQAKAQQEIKENGPAVKPGTPIEITKIDFKPDRLTFEINGGGKNGRHWYQHIEIGMGNTTQPIAPQDPNQAMVYGAYITLKFPGRVPQLTVAETKQLLAPVLDFERHSPTVLYSPSVPPKFKEAIKSHQVLVGMDHDAVLSAKGPPDRKVREDQPDGSEKEDWIYGLPPHVLYVTFDGDTVVRVKQY
jgi:hypothetical protein